MNLYLDIPHGLVFEACLTSPTVERIVVKAGSEASTTGFKANGQAYVDRKRDARQALVDEGILVPHLRNPNVLIFTRDHEFASPGAAAEVLLGKNKKRTNGLARQGNRPVTIRNKRAE